MGVLSFRQVASLLLAGACLTQLAAAQTIIDGGIVVAADEITIAPAFEEVTYKFLKSTSQLPFDKAETLQLTDAVMANLTALQLTNIDLFDFSTPEADLEKRAQASCKVFPGDAAWPSRLVWKVFHLLTGLAVIETVPIGAVCYKSSGKYNASKCQKLLDNWTLGKTHSDDPTSVMSPIYQGETCMPANGANSSATCMLGGFPSYVVEVRNVAQIQLAINFARNTNLRLVVKNTGHDFLGKSAGAGALSIWTHNLKGITFVKSIRTPSYNGAAFKIGAGVQVEELYQAAHENGVTTVGGECKTVGVSGGYIAGGGHSPLSSKYGMGADQVLSIDVVLPNGRFVTADETHNTDLFWALRGGGGATFGVVTSLTVKALPKMSFSGVKWSIVTTEVGLSDETFFKVLFAYWRKFPQFAEKGSYGYSTIFPLGPGGGYAWDMLPWLVPGMPLAEFKAMIAPLLAEWASLGFQLSPTYFEHDNFYDTYKSHFPDETVANINMHTGSRLFPQSQWDSTESLESMMEAVKSVMEDGSALVQYNIKGDAPAGTPASAVNSHWRDTAWHGIIGAVWAPNDREAYEVMNHKVTNSWMERLRAYGPGGYGNEGDVMEPRFGEAFFGSNYERLLSIKRSVDPNDVFWAPTAVGSDCWAVQGQDKFLTLQTGRLCRTEACT